VVKVIRPEVYQLQRNQWYEFTQHVEYRVAKEILSLVFSFIFHFLSLSLSSGSRSGMERRRPIVQENISVRKGNNSFS
jgi:hypothetical protein